MAQSLKEKTATGLFWGGISNGAQQLLGMLFGIFLARILKAEDYGLIGMLAIFSGIASTIINSGFSVALTNKVDADQDDYNAVFWFSTVVSLFLYAILFIAAPFIADFYNKVELISLSRLIFISFIFSGLAIVPSTILFKQMKVKEKAIIDIVSLSVSGVLGVALAVGGGKYWALAVQSTTYIVTNSILSFKFTYWRPTLSFHLQPLREMFGFSVKLFLTNIFVQISDNFFSVLLGRFYSAKLVGYYSQGYKWTVMGRSLIAGMINSVSQPMLVEMSDNVSRQKNAFRKMLRFGSFLSFPLMLGLAFVGKEFIIITVGEKWLPSVVFLQLFSFWGAFSFFMSMCTSLLFTYGKSDVYMGGTVFVGILQILVVSSFFKLGILAMMIAYILALFIGLFIFLVYIKKIIQLRWFEIIEDMFPSLLITVVTLALAYFFTYFIHNVYVLFISKILLSFLLYFALSWIKFRNLILEMVSFLINLIRK